MILPVLEANISIFNLFLLRIQQLVSFANDLAWINDTTTSVEKVTSKIYFISYYELPFLESNLLYNITIFVK